MSKTLFDKIDESEFKVGRFTLIFPMSNMREIRRRILVLVILSAMFWIFWGFDSTWEMATPITDRLLTNPIEFFNTVLNPSSPAYQKLLAEMASVYGIGDHWSAPVIYGICFIALSFYLERAGVVRSLNFFVSTGLSLGNIGFFELIWNRLYSWLQGQPWTFSFIIPQQIRNLSFFIVFVGLGILSFLILRGLGYRIALTKTKAILILVATGLWLLWVFYPLPISYVTVPTTWGLWTNVNLFPQTFYAVQISPGITVPFYAPNDLLHLLNVVCKAVSAAAFTSLCMMVKKK